ncbi:MAG TPA: nitroreductase family protein [Bacillota bacterium]|nr:nitroreductase family protein [Bacillota bacterium]
MNTIEAIYGRRSIRKFNTDPVSTELIEKIIRAGIQAPSGMNRQPWKFTILQTEKKAQLLEIMSKRAQWLKKFKMNTEGYEFTIQSMRQAPLIILVWNTGFQPKPIFIPFYRYLRLIDIQSIGGAIQTMLLAAQELGLGTLWICNVFRADKQIRTFLRKREELIAAIAIGYANEQPEARPRKDWIEAVET